MGAAVEVDAYDRLAIIAERNSERFNDEAMVDEILIEEVEIADCEFGGCLQAWKMRSVVEKGAIAEQDSCGRTRWIRVRGK